MPVTTIEWIDGKVKLIDQTLLPNEVKYIYCDSVQSVWEAIKKLKVRGAPAIGIAGALGAVLGVWHSEATTYEAFEAQLEQTTDYLATSRPTAVNLFWALDRMKSIANRNKNSSIE